jgi:CDP-diacylglycerol--serine O-phosphatidyltransferase
VRASTGDPLTASYAIFVAAVFDMLDGRAARLTGSESRFGAEYDSIADTVSFGLAPAVIAFHSGGLIEMQWAGWVMAFVYTACGSLRLARFNVSSGRYRDRFDGLPTPAAAGMVVSTVWFGGFLQSHGLGFSLAPVVAATGLVFVQRDGAHGDHDIGADSRTGGKFLRHRSRLCSLGSPGLVVAPPDGAHARGGGE